MALMFALKSSFIDDFSLPCLMTVCTWWLIPLSKWVITPVISGLTLLIPFITGVITHLRAVGWATTYWSSTPGRVSRVSPLRLRRIGMPLCRWTTSASFTQTFPSTWGWVNFITTEPCSPEPWKSWLVRNIIPFYGLKIQVSEIW